MLSACLSSETSSGKPSSPLVAPRLQPPPYLYSIRHARMELQGSRSVPHTQARTCATQHPNICTRVSHSHVHTSSHRTHLPLQTNGLKFVYLIYLQNHMDTHLNACCVGVNTFTPKCSLHLHGSTEHLDI